MVERIVANDKIRVRFPVAAQIKQHPLGAVLFVRLQGAALRVQSVARIEKVAYDFET